MSGGRQFWNSDCALLPPVLAAGSAPFGFAECAFSVRATCPLPWSSTWEMRRKSCVWNAGPTPNSLPKSGGCFRSLGLFPPFGPFKYFQGYSSVALNAFTLSCSRLCHPSPGPFHLTKLKFHASEIAFPHSYPPSPWHPPFCLYEVDSSRCLV